MKRTLLSLALLGLLGTVSVAQAISLAINGPAGPVAQGSPISLEVVISGLGNGAAPSLGSFDLDLHFDPAVLGFSSGSLGDPVLGDQLDLFGLGSSGGITPTGPGILDLLEISFDSASDLDSLQAGTFTLATFTFNAVGAGTTALTLSVQGLSDANGDPLDATGTIPVSGTTLTVLPAQTVPEPGVAALLVAGLVGIFGFRRGKDRSKA